MSETRDHSYYEIALTNRQVMSMFIVLLICLLASFVSGVWIGRQGAGVRVQTADAQRIESGSVEGEPPLGEMDFFSSSARTRTGPGATQPSAAGETAAAAEAETTVVRQPDAAAEAPAPAQRPRREPAAPAQSADRPPVPAAEGEFLYIQVFSSMDRAQAQAIVERLRQDGYAAFLSSVEVESRLMHRVRIGPYAQRDEAEKVAATVQRKHKLSTWITP